MKMNDPPYDPRILRGTLELSHEVMRGQEAIRRAIRLGKIRATKVGNTHAFTQEQWSAAVTYYRALDARREGHGGADRPS